MLQTEELQSMMVNIGTQSDSLLLTEYGDMNLDQETVNFINLGMSLQQAQNIRTAVCSVL